MFVFAGPDVYAYQAAAAWLSQTYLVYLVCVFLPL